MTRWLNFKLILLMFLTGGCAYTPPSNYARRVVETPEFNLMSWQKLEQPGAEITFYIEGDGHAFNANGFASKDPTPGQTTMRKIAFRDLDSNVVYLARPCQFVSSPRCEKKYWTTGRFAPEVIAAEASAIRKIMQANRSSSAVLVGYSGGAMVAGLIAVRNPDMHIRKIITVAGLLEHKNWTAYHKVPPLKDSLDLSDYQEAFAKIPQQHFLGAKDKIIVRDLMPVSDKKLIVFENASHSEGWDELDLKEFK